MDLDQISLICKALGDTSRLNIVKLLTRGEKCGCELLKQLQIGQPTLSHHMKVLSECGLVQVRKSAKWSYYSLNCEKLRDFQRFIGNLDCEIKDSCAAGKCECQ